MTTVARSVVPTGRLEAEPVRRRTITTPPAVDPVPRQHERAWLALAAELIGDVAAVDYLTRLTLPGLLETAVAARARAFYADGGVRRGVALAHAAAMLYVSRCTPADLHFAGDEVEALARREGSPVRHAAAAAPAIGRRLAWAVHDDAGAGLMLDRLHHGWLGDLLLTPWMRRQIAADQQIGRHLAGSHFRGVRVIAHQVLGASLHVTAAGDEHRLGGCALCQPGGCWA